MGLLKFMTTADIDYEEDDDEEEDLSIEYIRKLPETDFLDFITAADYLNIQDLREFCVEFAHRTWSNTPISSIDSQILDDVQDDRTFSVTTEKVEYLEEDVDFHVDEDIYC